MAKVLVIFGIVLTHHTLTTTDSIAECPLKSPCSCQNHKLICTSVRLTELPPLVSTDRTYDDIDLRYNSITRVEDGYFSNLSVSDSLVINLGNNRINYIGPRAFQGLENVTLDLYLDHNDLVALPTALLQLNQLQRLQIGGIYTYDPTIMEHITKKTITDLRVGQLTHWPQDLMLSLGHVKQLSLFELRIPKLSAENVTNFVRDFDILSIENSYFLEPLDGFCDIKHNYSLNLIGLSAPAGVELVPNCQPPASQIKGLDLLGIYVSNVSRTLESMPGIKNMWIVLPYLRSLILPANNVIEYIALEAPLEKFPTSVGISGHLDVLNMNCNISSITAEDLRNFPNLGQLILLKSSLTAISENVFENNKALYLLQINNSKLTSIPKAVLHIPNLLILNLDNNPIKCSCDMTWLLGWPKLASIDFFGYCMDKETLFSIYTKYLGHCVNNPVIG